MGRPGKAKPKAKAPTAAALAKAAANAIFVWAQCDNAGCQKWRKLPPGTKIDENNPWCVPHTPAGYGGSKEGCHQAKCTHLALSAHV